MADPLRGLKNPEPFTPRYNQVYSPYSQMPSHADANEWVDLNLHLYLADVQ
jgi:hypothetical protein